MKITLSIFKKKQAKEKSKNIKIPCLSILFCINCISFICIMFSSSNMLIFATNFYGMKIEKLTVKELAFQNSLLNPSSYKYSVVDNVEKKEDNYIPNDAEALLDKIAMNSMNTMVFSNINAQDISVVTENNNYQKLSVCGVDVTNYSTNRKIDFSKILMMENKEFNSLDEVAIYTTHTSESYANSPNYTFDYSSAARTLDGNYNMLNIASTFARNLNSKGINTVCSLNPHDYGEYNSAYSNSRNTLGEIIQNNPNVKIAVDVHRDAIEDLSFAPKLDIMGYNVACVMLVMGIGYEGEENPYYEENLKLALQLQILGNKIYPGLFRPMIIRNSVYNQDLMENSFLIEVGATGNTIDEAILATRCLANLLNIMYNH